MTTNKATERAVECAINFADPGRHTCRCTLPAGHTGSHFDCDAAGFIPEWHEAAWNAAHEREA